jgi:hypothetical protein
MIHYQTTFPIPVIYPSHEQYVASEPAIVFVGEQQLTIQPSVTVDERHINTAPQSLAESDGEDELIDDDEEIDEDAIAGGSVSRIPCRPHGS